MREQSLERAEGRIMQPRLASRRLSLRGALIMITWTMTSAFLPASPPQLSPSSSWVIVQDARRLDAGSGSGRSRRTRGFHGVRGGVVPHQSSEMVLGGLGGSAGNLLPTVGTIVSGAIIDAQAHFAGSGIGAGMLLLAEDSDTPGKMYARIATGGVAIAFSAVFGAYIIATLVANMSTEDLMKLNRDLAGGEEYEELERERVSAQARLAALSEDIEDAKDPARSLAMAPDGVRERKMEKLTARTAAAATDIASIEDEYAD